MKETAEAVSLDHPNKTADYISNYLLDRLIEQDPNIRYAIEVMVKDNKVVLDSEIASKGELGNIKAHISKLFEKSGIMNTMPKFGEQMP